MLSDEDWLEAASFALPIARWPRRWAASTLLMQVDAACRPCAGVCRGRGGRALRRAAADGRKALLARWRQEAADALRFLDAARAEALRQQVAHLQFFN
jgi:tRNA(Met) cytidine acetyltransferase